MKKKARIAEIQYLRGLAFLAVVMQHAIAHYAYSPEARLPDGVALGFILLAAKFAVPLFVFITGLVLFYNYDGQLHYFDFVKKRFKDIIVPYLFWSVIYILVNQLLDKQLWSGLRQLGLLMLTGKSSYHLWYIVMIFQFYLLFPLFRYLFRVAKRFIQTEVRAFVAVVALGVFYLFLTTQVVALGQVMTNGHIPVLQDLFTTYADRNFLYFFYYFVLGAVAGVSIEKWRGFVLKYQTILTVLFLLMFGFFVYKVTSSYQLTPTFQINLNDTFLIQPVMAVLLILFIPFIYRLSMLLDNRAGKWTLNVLDKLGYYSYGAYLIHALMLSFGELVADRLMPAWNVTIRMLFTFVVAAMLSVALTYLFSKLPFGKWTVGIGRKKARPVVQGNLPMAQ